MAKSNFYWDPVEDNIVREYDEAGVVTAEYTTEPDLYGNVISQRRQGEYRQFHYDCQGSTLAATDENQNTIDTFAYADYGKVTERSGSTIIPFLYIGHKGYYWDSLSGQYLVRRRAYAPATARFQSRDPLREDGVDLLYPPSALDPYRYVRNNPVNQVDPSGLAANVCCECDELWRQLLGESDYQYDFYLIRAGKNTCRVSVACEATKSCRGLPGSTAPPVPVKDNPLYNYEIGICVSCRYKPTDLVFYHELEHAKQYCKNPALDLTKCTPCRDAEEAAHKVNCKLAFPQDNEKFRRCWNCGSRISCQGVCKFPTDKQGRVLFEGKPCDVVGELGGEGPWTPNPEE